VRRRQKDRHTDGWTDRRTDDERTGKTRNVAREHGRVIINCQWSLFPVNARCPIKQIYVSLAAGSDT